ncbi:MAG: hypothetical protein FWC16_00350 [Defluviitaleaceae bacterium]|nr:hypothetical protein [Defluviitaleaceae bacterium]MCL2273353.1 hypothetical protein [Defluviitaleaceae bacterium]
MSKNIKKCGKYIMLTMLTLTLCLHPLSAFASSRFSTSNLIIHYETVDPVGGVFESLSEYNGSIFYTRRTNEYIYSSQLTPSGHYDFAFRFINSLHILTATIVLEDLLVHDNTVNRERSRSTTVYNSYRVASIIMNNLPNLATNIVQMDFVANTPFEIDLFAPEAYSFGISPFSNVPAPPGAIVNHPFRLRTNEVAYPTMAALISGDFQPMHFERTVAAITESRSGIMARAAMVQNFTLTPGRQTVFFGTFRVTTNMTVAVVGAALGASASKVLAIIGFVASTTGVLLAIADFFVTEHFVEEHYRHHVTINGAMTGGFMTRTIRWSVISALDTRNNVERFVINPTGGPTRDQAFPQMAPFHNPNPMLQQALNDFFRAQGIW